MRIEEIFPPDKLFPPNWAAPTHKVRLTAYQTRSAVDTISGVSIITPMAIILFYSGPLTYDHSVAKPGVELVDGSARISFGTTEFGTTSSSRWIFIYKPEGTDQQPELERSIEGLLRFTLNSRLLLTKVFTRIIDLKSPTQSMSSHSLLNPYMMGPETLTTNSTSALKNALDRIQSLMPAERDLTLRSLRWLNDAFDDTDKWDSFLKVWIAIEMAFVRKAQAPTVLRNVICKAYGLTAEEANRLFSVGRLYGLRKQILHQGELPPFDPMLIEALADLFRDLLAWTLTGSCPMIAVSRLNTDGTTFRNLIEGKDNEKGST